MFQIVSENSAKFNQNDGYPGKANKNEKING